MIYRKEYMLRGTGSQLGKMKVGPEIRSVVKFSRMNLNDPVYAVEGQFDFIFCRNVLIYFDHESKTRVVERLLDHLAPGGCLFLGYAETATTLSERLHGVGPNVYARTAEAAPRSLESWRPSDSSSASPPSCSLVCRPRTLQTRRST